MFKRIIDIIVSGLCYCDLDLNVPASKKYIVNYDKMKDEMGRMLLDACGKSDADYHHEERFFVPSELYNAILVYEKQITCSDSLYILENLRNVKNNIKLKEFNKNDEM